jgi:hypothetical protein
MFFMLMGGMTGKGFGVIGVTACVGRVATAEHAAHRGNATAALGFDTEMPKHLGVAGRAVDFGRADIDIGQGVADADVHDTSSSNGHSSLASEQYMVRDCDTIAINRIAR